MLGVEATVSLCVDALFPVSALVDLCAGFAKQFPSVDLRVDTQVMSAVSERVLRGAATSGVATPLGVAPGPERKVLSPIRMIAVVGPGHPLASTKGLIPTRRIADAIQIVLSSLEPAGRIATSVPSRRTST